MTAQGRRWTKEEEAVLRAKYRGTPREVIAAELNRSPGCLLHKARNLGLTKRARRYEGQIKVKPAPNGKFKAMIYTGGRQVSYMRYLWEKHHGPVPKNMRVVNVSGDPLGFRWVKNLELRSLRLHMLTSSGMPIDEAVAFDLIAELKDLHNIKRRIRNGKNINERPA